MAPGPRADRHPVMSISGLRTRELLWTLGHRPEIGYEVDGPAGEAELCPEVVPVERDCARRHVEEPRDFLGPFPQAHQVRDLDLRRGELEFPGVELADE